MTHDAITQAIVEMDDEKVGDLVRKALDERSDPNEILEQGLIPGMREVAALFARKDYFVPEVLLAAESFYAGFNIIMPLIRSSGRKPRAKVVMGVVEGDIHDIGKNIVKVLLESNGYEVIDLGKDIPCATFVEAVMREKPGILALSSLMTTTMTRMEEVVALLESNGLRKRIKVMVGGAPVNEAFARSIGADGYSADAPSAVQLADRLLNENSTR